MQWPMPKPLPNPLLPQIGYVLLKAGVKSELYDATLRSDRPCPRSKNNNGQSKVCSNNDTATWILG